MLADTALKARPRRPFLGTQAWICSRRLHRWIFSLQDHQRHPWGFLFKGFNKTFDYANRGIWQKPSPACCGVAVIVLLVYGGLIALTLMGFNAMPKGFIPDQDKDIWCSTPSFRTAQVCPHR